MKRIFILFFLLFFIVQLHPLYAQTPSPLPSGAVMSVDGVLIPGLTCGLAGDADPGKAKCCVPKKQDDSIFITVANWAVGKPIVGDLSTGFIEKYKVIDQLSQSMDPCISPGVASTKNLSDKSCICIKSASSSAIPQLNEFCEKYFSLTTNNNELQKCSRCMIETGGFYTAIGCIPLDLSTFITNYILNIGIGIAGGVALLCIFYSAFRMQSSMGNAEAIKKAQENLTACITGLIIIIFSVLILKIIGVDILRIPGLGK